MEDQKQIDSNIKSYFHQWCTKKGLTPVFESRPTGKRIRIKNNLQIFVLSLKLIDCPATIFGIREFDYTNKLIKKKNVLRYLYCIYSYINLTFSLI